MNESAEKMPRSALCGWILILAGFVFASMFANGSELSGLALVVPFLATGALLCVSIRGQIFDSAQCCLVGLAVVYFLVRGFMSPVWDLARRDLFLVVCGSLAFFASQSVLRYRVARIFLVVGVALVLFGNCVLSVVQYFDPEYAFLRSSRSDQLGVSGFYFHRNYLAGFLEIAFPLFLVCTLQSRKSLLTFWILLFLSLLCLALCFASNSRGGFVATLVGGGVAFVMQSVCTAKVSRLGFKQVLFLACLGVLALFLGWFGLNSILERREGVAAGLGNRFYMAGIAIEIWEKFPLFGAGSHSYSYLFPSYFSGLVVWYGNAVMAHSDYFQVLCDYGIVGLGCVVVLLLLFGSQIFYPNPERKTWLTFVFAGVLVAEALRAIFDFNLHIAPNLILFSILAGGVLSCSRPTYVKDRPRKNLLLPVVIIFTFGLSVVGFLAGWKEIASAKIWIRLVRLEEGEEGLLRKYSENAPSFSVLRKVARTSLKSANEASPREAAAFTLAASDWKNVVERHPFDPESLANYARCLDENGDFSTAENFHLRALKAAGRREAMYGVVYGAGWHLARRGEQVLGQRSSSEALFLYQQADLIFEESARRGFSRQNLNVNARKWIKGRIDFLEGARIEPLEVPILDWRAPLE